MTTIDMRVPVRLAGAGQGSPGEALLAEGVHFTAVQAHPAGCACCAARNPAGVALASLLQDRARGKVAFFRSVTAVTHSPAGRAMVLEALRSDPVAGACFRLEA